MPLILSASKYSRCNFRGRNEQFQITTKSRKEPSWSFLLVSDIWHRIHCADFWEIFQYLGNFVFVFLGHTHTNCAVFLVVGVEMGKKWMSTLALFLYAPKPLRANKPPKGHLTYSALFFKIPWVVPCALWRCLMLIRREKVSGWFMYCSSTS